MVAGNLYTSEVETTRNDASYGKLLLGNGDGTFKPSSFSESGFYIKGDTKDIQKLIIKNGIAIIAANNNDFIQLIKHNKNSVDKIQ